MSGFRLDRFLTLYFFHPLIKKRERADDKKIPILMYHSISDDEEENLHYYYRINTSPKIFTEHMRYLHENNYSVIRLQDISNYYSCLQDANKYVVITFDDGYDDFYTKAFPILQEHSFPATVFLPTAFIGNKKLKLKGKEHLDWSQVSELSDMGISFGSHTVTHPELRGLRNEDVEYELMQSKKTIEDKLGKSIDTFSYPFKFPEENRKFITLLKEILENSGYNLGVSTRIGTTSKRDDIYFMKRIAINSKDDILLFQAKLEGGYDWLYKVQRFSKIIIALIR
jgi:peptidoglycan/xylan/chitin deacetylase (PgdA/CDA1 family)